MKKLTALLICSSLLSIPLMAEAYVGPGAGLSLLGALWALILALGTAVLFVLAWPIRRLLRHRREARLENEAIDGDATSTVDATNQRPHP
jgi:predicted Kef-type K+ transport protein